jgi:hypothetical protein
VPKWKYQTCSLLMTIFGKLVRILLPFWDRFVFNSNLRSFKWKFPFCWSKRQSDINDLNKSFFGSELSTVLRKHAIERLRMEKHWEINTQNVLKGKQFRWWWLDWYYWVLWFFWSFGGVWKLRHRKIVERWKKRSKIKKYQRIVQLKNDKKK